MAIYLVGYDIHPAEGEKYEELFNILDAYDVSWHCLGSTWLIQTSETAAELRDTLSQHMKSDDQLLILKYPESGGGRWASYGFTGDCADWLEDQLSFSSSVKQPI